MKNTKCKRGKDVMIKVRKKQKEIKINEMIVNHCGNEMTQGNRRLCPIYR